jgi:hypothetical protein
MGVLAIRQSIAADSDVPRLHAIKPALIERFLSFSV